MQFRLKHLFPIVFAFALVALLAKFLFDNPPQMSARVLLILASPAAMGLGIITLSLARMMNSSANNTASDPLYSAKYKSLAWIGLLTTMPLVAYIAYSCFAAAQLDK